MRTETRNVVVGVFHDPQHARDAIGALKDADFSGNDISLLMPDRDQTRDVAAETGTQAGTGAATGAVAGGLLGGLGASCSTASMEVGRLPCWCDPFFNRLRALRPICRPARAAPQGCPSGAIVTL